MTQPEGIWDAHRVLGSSWGPVISLEPQQFQHVSSSFLMSPIVPPFLVTGQRHVLFSQASLVSPPSSLSSPHYLTPSPLPRVFLRPFPVAVKASIVPWTLTDPSVVG